MFTESRIHRIPRFPRKPGPLGFPPRESRIHRIPRFRKSGNLEIGDFGNRISSKGRTLGVETHRCHWQVPSKNTVSICLDMISDIKCNVIYYLEWHISDAICAIKKSLDAISWQVRACGRSPPGQLHISHLAGQRVWQVPATKLDCNIKYRMLCQISDAISPIECNVIYRMQYAQ